MPQLPSLGDIPQAQFDRIVASFPGATLTEKAENYKNWMTNRLIEWVEGYETAVVLQEQAAEREAVMEEVRASLPPRRPEPTYSVPEPGGTP